MKSDKKILLAFCLNLFFSIFEFFGGVFTNSVSIISDAIHDMGDALSIGIAYFLEKLSKKKPDSVYTYGYTRYSVIGSLITVVILIVGSVFVIYNAIRRVINPVDINYNGMIMFAVVGVIVNFLAVYFTKDGHSLNQKAVNLHMLEDVLGWIVVLIGSIIMKFTDIRIIDPILSIILGIYILWNALGNFKEIVSLFLERIPKDIRLEDIKNNILAIDGVIDVHHIHIWSMDGYKNYATMHVVSDDCNVKYLVKKKMMEIGVNHTTVEIESSSEECSDKLCKNDIKVKCHHHHH